MISVNLIPRDRLTRRLRRSWTRLWIAVCLTYVLIVAAVLCICSAAWGTDNAALADDLEVASLAAKDSADSIARLRRELIEAQAALEANKTMSRHPDWSALLVVLAKELGDDAVLDRCMLSPLEGDRPAPRPGTNAGDAPPRDIFLGQRRYKLELSGFARTHVAVSRFVLRLESIELFRDVKLTKSIRQPFMADKAVAFKIDCSI